MHIHDLTTTEIEDITWARFLEMISTKYVMITTDQWRAIISRNITGKDTLLQRVTDLFAATPVIGFTPDNKVVIRTGVDLKTEIIDDTCVWVTSTWFGTYTGTNTTILTVDTTMEVNEIILPTFTEFLSLTTDNLSDVALIHFTHDVKGLTRTSYIYCNGKVKLTPLPDGATFLTGFKLITGNKANAVEALDQNGRPFPGILVLEGLNVEYEAITVPETVPSN